MPPPPADDYYAILGVHAGVNVDELRRAWRGLAARWHPDRAGVAATATFQRLSAAYTVLSDPVARAAYDRRRRITPTPKTAVPTAAPRPSAPGPARPSAPAVMLRRLCGHLSMLLARGAADLDEPGYITLLLSPAEAAQGGMATISLNVDLHCPDCAKHAAPTTCPRCHGQRIIEELYSAWLAIRPGATDGEVLRPSAELPGMVQPVRFRARLRGAR
jgi:molecular chaperone DnaJ/curved DNA-binding protein